ncbi:hypothetical protein HNQ94_002002 [Salirhabdus euzebyi]|uniref:Pathogenicity locus n=1 Tax=Salirhabdus euzebyi TaxID=394506 RepID=A0A841Q5B9_9BACI|nr:helix-hairpin-helix domain-containing protein [Salirhabdus euzebyi]MBB6453553.1 hypothetical protein [Salirhabdus euzebyi]
MKKANPKLPLTDEERSSLRKSKIKLNTIIDMEETELSNVLNSSLQRASELRGLAIFQTVPSIGLKLAEKLVYKLNLYSLTDIKDKDGAQLLDELEVKLGVWTDPCVEDQIRCVIHYANNPSDDVQWFHFTEKRKWYRTKHGYPNSRPKMAWYE